jgi:hypothetical protein
MMCPWKLSALSVIVAAGAAGTLRQGPSVEASSPLPRIDEGNLRKWIDFVRPDAKEAKYKEIGWRTDFEAAIKEAKRLQQPILLWTMNGHPMACT